MQVDKPVSKRVFVVEDDPDTRDTLVPSQVGRFKVVAWPPAACDGSGSGFAFVWFC
jgi:hypothetical protein